VERVLSRRSRIGAGLAGILVAAVALTAPPADAACEISLDGGPLVEGSCGPLNPPQVFGIGGGGTPPPPRVILWTSGYDLNPLNGNQSGIWISRVDGTQRRRLVSFSNLNRDFEPHGLNLPDDHPSFSPDNRRIVFTSNRADRDNWDIYVMNVNGTGVTRLTATAGLDTEPVFSPDGTKIAFATERFGGNLDIAVMNVNGTGVTRVTTSGFDDIEPAWRPDGQKIAFARVFSKSEKDVFTINPNGTGEFRVTNVPKEDHDPSYSPSGQELVITSERSPTSPPYGNVHKIRASDGFGLGNLTSDLNLAAGDPFWSRDGGLIAFFKSTFIEVHSPQKLFVMNAFGGGKFNVPGEASVNIHPALGLGIDDDGDGTPNYLESGSVGRASFSPHRARANRTGRFRFDWKHPRRWRKLDTIWLRVSHKRWLLGMVRFSVPRRSFSLFDGLHDRYTRARRPGRGRLRTSLFTLNLRRTRAVGINRKRIRLVLAVRFRRKVKGYPFRLAGKRLRIRAQANTRRGRNQEEELRGLRILPPR
jgi:Tol biopolymer transport system component